MISVAIFITELELFSFDLDELDLCRILLHGATLTEMTLRHAGCDAADVLNHCNQIGGHVTGCWVVDLVLDK